MKITILNKQIKNPLRRHQIVCDGQDYMYLILGIDGFQGQIVSMRSQYNKQNFTVLQQFRFIRRLMKNYAMMQGMKL